MNRMSPHLCQVQGNIDVNLCLIYILNGTMMIAVAEHPRECTPIVDASLSCTPLESGTSL